MDRSAFRRFMALFASARESFDSVVPSSPTPPPMPLFVLDTEMTREEWKSKLTEVDRIAKRLLKQGIDPWDYRKTFWPYGSPSI